MFQHLLSTDSLFFGLEVRDQPSMLEDDPAFDKNPFEYKLVDDLVQDIKRDDNDSRSNSDQFDHNQTNQTKPKAIAKEKPYAGILKSKRTLLKKRCHLQT